MKYWSVVMVLALTLGGMDAHAKRLGGARSIGKQSAPVTQRQATQTQSAPSQAPASQTATAPNQPAPTGAPAAGAKRPWGSMLGGLAAGLGLAWLAQSLGLGAAFGQFLLIGLLALGVMFVWGMVQRSRRPMAARQPLAFQGAGQVDSLPSYSPENVGNDASARPFERSSNMGLGSVPARGGSGVVIGSALASQKWGVPADFDVEGFLNTARRNFILLQSAWDRADMTTLRSMMTDDMLGEIRAQLSEREQHAGSEPNQTEVQMLQAQLLGIEDLGDEYMASVEFSGMIREDAFAGPGPFREVWNMTKPKDGSRGWLVAGVQALQ